MNPASIEDLMRPVSVDEARQIIGCCRDTLFRMIKAGSAPKSYRAGRRRLFRLGAIREWQAAQEAGVKAKEKAPW